MVILSKDRIEEIIIFAQRHSSFWEKRLQGKNFQDIPILRKSDLPKIQKDNPPFGGLTTNSDKHHARIFMSPGPIYDPQGEDGDAWHFAEALKTAGFTSDDIVQNTFSYHLSPAGFMFDSALRKLGATVIPAGFGNTELQVQILKDVEVTGFVGTPSFFNTLLERAKELGYKLGEELLLNKAFFTAERLPKSLKEKWMEQGIKVFEGYGTADVGCIAYEDDEYKGLKINSSAVYVEICDPETGQPQDKNEIGEVVVTRFDKTYPLIRFGTGDLSSWTNNEKGKYITGVLGRVGDGIKVKGMFVHLKQFAAILDECKAIDYYQAIVDRENNKDRLTIYIEVNDTHISVDSLLQKLKNVIRVTPEIEIVPLHLLHRDEPQLLDKRQWD